MPTLRLVNISKTFKSSGKVLDDITIEVPSDRFTVVVGPSGCGKTTLLRIIAGLETPSSGEIFYDTELWNDVPPSQRRIGMVFQNYALYPHLTVEENLAFPLKINKFDRKEIQTKVHQIARLLKLEHQLNKKPRELSGGERQRVALGRAIIKAPKIFLFDEPLSNLDAKLRVSMRNEITNLVHQLNIPSIYVTHDQLEALTMGDQIVVLNEGRIQQIASPTEIYNKPSNTFVAKFIGTPQINLFPCHKTDDFFVQENHKLFKIEIPPTLYGKLPEEFDLGIRPEHLAIAESDSFDFEIEIKGIEFIGHERILYFAWQNQLYSALQKVIKYEVQPNEKVRFKIDEQKLLFFDKKGILIC